MLSCSYCNSFWHLLSCFFLSLFFCTHPREYFISVQNTWLLLQVTWTSTYLCSYLISQSCGSSIMHKMRKKCNCCDFYRGLIGGAGQAGLRTETLSSSLSLKLPLKNCTGEDQKSLAWSDESWFLLRHTHGCQNIRTAAWIHGPNLLFVNSPDWWRCGTLGLLIPILYCLIASTFCNHVHHFIAAITHLLATFSMIMHHVIKQTSLWW